MSWGAIAGSITSAIGGTMGMVGAGTAARRERSDGQLAYERSITAGQMNTRGRTLPVLGSELTDLYVLAMTPKHGTTAAQNRRIDRAKAELERRMPNVLGVTQRAGQAQAGELAGMERGYRADTGRLNMLAAGMEGAGGDLRARQEAMIRRDSERALADANNATMGRMGLMGVNTLTEQGMRGNMAANERARSDAMLNNDQAALQRFLAARGNRMNVIDQRGRGLASMLGTNSQIRYGNLVSPAMQIAQIMQGAGANAVVNQNQRQYLTGADPTAASLISGGNSLSAYGGSMMGMGGGMMGGGGGGGQSQQPNSALGNWQQRPAYA